MLRLDPPLPLLLRRNGAWVKGLAHVLLDPGTEHDLQWVCFADESRECWTLRNQDVRAQDNVTAGRMPEPRDYPGGPLVVGEEF